MLEKNRQYILLIIVIVIGAFLRFYKLDWGQGLFTHPDEYHIVASVNQLSFPTQMHPHLFIYGTVTIYLIYFTQEILKYISSVLSPEFLVPSPFLLGRFYSALFSTLTIFIVYKISTTFFAKKQFSLIAAFLVAITPGIIQQAHFATTESALTFFLFGSLLFIIKFLKQNKILFLLLASVFLGFAMGVKVSSIVFLLPLIAAIIIKSYPKNLSFKTPILFIKHALKTLLKFTGLTLTSVIIAATTFALVAPYVFLDFPAFRGNMEYEGGLAIGRFQVFYTRQFIDTIPVLFQIEKILPYALGPILLVLSILGLAFLVVSIVKSYRHLGWWQAERTRSHDSSEVDDHLRGVHSATSKVFIIITIAFLSLFLPNAFLFAKWTRFIAPTFPFFAIFAAFFLQWLSKRTKPLSNSLIIILLVSTILWTTAFFSIYINRDIRITASKWLVSNALSQSVIVIEGGNMIDIPLEGNFTRLGFDFYNFEDNQGIRTDIAKGLERADYFLVQSRRVFLNHQRARKYFPKTAHFYDMLFTGKLGFTQIKEFHSYPTLEAGSWKLEVADEFAEETWSVFDHPVIRIFQKKTQLTKEEYAGFFEH